MKKNDLFDRPGCVTLTEKIIRQNPKAILLLQSKMLLYRMDYNVMTRTITYCGYSYLFNKIKAGEIIPYYQVWFTTYETGRVKIYSVERTIGPVLLQPPQSEVEPNARHSQSTPVDTRSQSE